MTRMAKLRILPRGITRILKTMNKPELSHQCVMIVVEPKPQENPGEDKVEDIYKDT
jgi:hypothetical protein